MRVAERDKASRQRYLMPPQLWLRLRKDEADSCLLNIVEREGNGDMLTTSTKTKTKTTDHCRRLSFLCLLVSSTWWSLSRLQSPMQLHICIQQQIDQQRSTHGLARRILATRSRDMVLIVTIPNTTFRMRTRWCRHQAIPATPAPATSITMT